MSLDLSEVVEILDFDDEEDAQARAEEERETMEGCLQALCASGILYSSSWALPAGGFDWIRRNRGFVARWLSARGDELVVDDDFEMIFVRARKVDRRRGVVSFKDDEVLVGCVLRYHFDADFVRSADRTVITSVSTIASMIKALSEGRKVPSGKAIDNILGRFKELGCVRPALGPQSEDRPITILPGIRAYFDDSYVQRATAALEASEPPTVNEESLETSDV